MEADNYLAGGYGTRLALQARKSGCSSLGSLAKVWQPSRLKGIQVSASFGTPFLAATQVFDLRPVPRKFLSLDKTDKSTERFVSSGTILVTCSGSVGRATVAYKSLENVLASHDLLRIEPHENDTQLRGWLYAYLRAPKVRAMMSSAQYGHIIKHLEVEHLNAMPMLRLRDDLLAKFNVGFQRILDARNKAHDSLLNAESLFAQTVGKVDTANVGEDSYAISASSFFNGRRRLEGFFHNPAVRSIRVHFMQRGLQTQTLKDCGFDAWLPNRFKRVDAKDGVPLLDSSDLFEINPDTARRIADRDFNDPFAGRVKVGWLLVARSGQVYGLNGSVAIANHFHEGKVVSDDVIRVAPNENANAKAGYVYVALSHPTLGRPLVKSEIYGSSIPHLEVADLSSIQIVRLPSTVEDEIACLASSSADAYAEADLIEIELADEAEQILNRYLQGETYEVVVAPTSTTRV